MRADRRAGGSDAAPSGMENTRGRSHNTVMGRLATPIGVCCIMAPLCDGLPSASPVAARQSRRDGSTSAASVGEDRRDWDGRERADSPAGRPVQGRRQATRPSVAVHPRRPSRDLPRRARSVAGKAALGRAASDPERAKATSGSPRGARPSRHRHGGRGRYARSPESLVHSLCACNIGVVGQRNSLRFRAIQKKTTVVQEARLLADGDLGRWNLLGRFTGSRIRSPPGPTSGG